ncbi:hypothetical protein Lepto7376_1908 [[Leptolyngbya] sp. PCC 7376]|uniref:hypothetical protein n=1 Tax=[Leptolyngbya] sp. PCC 7376 TaxID=111781 RepID=UPI00029EEF95|nr:hypothetical protein [[Leptolyngbya] sp. PCC 7376]AFY38225.1 hypothetical protein Lepto7376_1908 [[Leptolyngbya] sp. PCC 7376]
MQIIESIRNFLFPFEYEVTDPKISTEQSAKYTAQYSYLKRLKTEDGIEDSKEFIVSDSFLYLSNL